MRRKSVLKISKKAPDYLTPLLNIAPATWALIRANEIRALDRVKFKNPILDVGCGNGEVTKVILSRRKIKFDVGIDLSAKEIEFAKNSDCFKKCLVGDVYSLPFKKGTFATVFSNSVIEHIPNLETALSEMSRVLKKNGQFVITVPSSYLTEYLLGYRILNQMGLKSLAEVYGKFFNSLFKHYNLFNHKKWEKILKKHSLKLVEHHYYHTKKMVVVHEFLAYLAIPYHITKFISGYWVVFPEFRKIFITPWLKKLLNPVYLADVKTDEGGSLLLIAKKV